MKMLCKCIKSTYLFHAPHIYKYEKFKTSYIIYVGEYCATYDNNPNSGIYFGNYFITHEQLREEKINNLLNES